MKNRTLNAIAAIMAALVILAGGIVYAQNKSLKTDFYNDIGDTVVAQITETGSMSLDAGAVINDGGGNNDTRMESPLSPSMFLLDASDERVEIVNLRIGPNADGTETWVLGVTGDTIFRGVILLPDDDISVGGDDIDFTHATPTTDIGGGTGTWTINATKIDVVAELSVGGDDIDFTHATPTTDIGGGTGTWTINAASVGVSGELEAGGGYGSSGATISTDGAGQFNGSLTTDAQVNIGEITTPTPVADYGALYAKDDNGLYFQDGAGNEHIVHLEARSRIWFNGRAAATVTISTEDTWTIVDAFVRIGEEDENNIVVGSFVNNKLTLSAAGGGTYDVSYHISGTTTGGAVDFRVAVGVTLATAPTLTDATAASPIVVTFASPHGYWTGDMVTISGVAGGDVDEANGDWIVEFTGPSTLELYALDGTPSSGTGTYSAGGTVDIHYPGELAQIREVGTSSIGVIGGASTVALEDSDVLKLYAANLGGTTNFVVWSGVLNAERTDT